MMTRYNRFMGEYDPDTEYQALDVAMFHGDAYYRVAPGKGASPSDFGRSATWHRLNEDLSTVLELVGANGRWALHSETVLPEAVQSVTLDVPNAKSVILTMELEKAEGSTYETVFTQFQHKGSTVVNPGAGIVSYAGKQVSFVYVRLDDGVWVFDAYRGYQGDIANPVGAANVNNIKYEENFPYINKLYVYIPTAGTPITAGSKLRVYVKE